MVELNNSVNMPDIGLGTYLTPEGSVVQDSVKWALYAGYRHVDTATYYANERGIGKAIRDSCVPREEIFITTKLWNSDHEQVRKAFDKSLDELGTDYIDQYLIHWPVSQKRQNAWRALEDIYKEGLAKTIGVSNYTIRHLKELLDVCDIVPSVNQVEFNPFLYQKDLLSYCNSKGIMIVAYCPLVRAKRMDDPNIAAIASRFDKTPAQILIRWGLQHGMVSIPKSTNQTRIEENFNIFEFKLSHDDMDLLDSLDEGLRLTWDPQEIP